VFETAGEEFVKFAKNAADRPRLVFIRRPLTSKLQLFIFFDSDQPEINIFLQKLINQLGSSPN
jgi:hypothetical protein